MVGKEILYVTPKIKSLRLSKEFVIKTKTEREPALLINRNTEPKFLPGIVDLRASYQSKNIFCLSQSFTSREKDEKETLTYRAKTRFV